MLAPLLASILTLWSSNARIINFADSVGPSERRFWTYRDATVSTIQAAQEAAAAMQQAPTLRDTTVPTRRRHMAVIVCVVVGGGCFGLHWQPKTAHCVAPTPPLRAR